MSEVVFTNIDSFDEIATAVWHVGNQDPYAKAQKMAGRDDMMGLVGRRNKYGSVSIMYVRAKLSDAWNPISAWHLQIATFFKCKLLDAPTGDTLSPFFSEIENPAVANAVRQLVGIDVGSTAPAAEQHNAVRRISARLRDLGVPSGDWAFFPMIAAL